MSARPCRDVRVELSAYLDGDLDTGLTGETRAHLESCPACRAELDLLRLTVSALRRLPDLQPPAAILAGVRARLWPEPWYRRLLAGRNWFLGVPVGALATLLVIVGISLFQTRYPEMSKSVPQGSFPKSPAPPAPELPVKPAPIAAPSPAARTIVADRQAASESSALTGADTKEHYRATPAAPIEPVAPTALTAVDSKVDQSQPSRPEPQGAATKGSPAVLAREADSGAGLVSARLAGRKEKAAASPGIQVVCLLFPDGDTVNDLTLLLRREGAVDIAINVLEPQAVREAFAPHRARLGLLPGPVNGWTVTAGIPLSGFTRLIDALTIRTDLRILEQPAAPSALEDPTVPRDLRITLLR